MVDTSQSNPDTAGHHIPYPDVCLAVRGILCDIPIIMVLLKNY